jgi:predicted DNA-binding transcriptional regulator AlpA
LRSVRSMKDPTMTNRQTGTAPVRGEPHNPQRHHLDRRAHKLAEQDVGNNQDDLLDTRAVADWLDVSVQWLEIGRGKDYGPAFVRISPRCVRYRRGDVLAWLKERTHASTAEYKTEAA